LYIKQIGLAKEEGRSARDARVWAAGHSASNLRPTILFEKRICERPRRSAVQRKVTADLGRDREDWGLLLILEKDVSEIASGVAYHTRQIRPFR
jgi:hypothetical protein